jgi:hypothetical protein
VPHLANEPTLAARDAAFARFEERRERGLIPASVDFSDWLLANDPWLWDAVAAIEEVGL